MQAESDSDEEEQQIYNPLKLPMGWDGKPIPYWLYKLHGLGQVSTLCSQPRAANSPMSTFYLRIQVQFSGVLCCFQDVVKTIYVKKFLSTWILALVFLACHYPQNLTAKTCRSSSVRFVETTATGVVGPLRGILRNGGISMVCAVLASPTQRTSMRSPSLRYTSSKVYLLVILKFF